MARHEEMQKELKKIREEEQKKEWDTQEETIARQRDINRQIQLDKIRKKGFITGRNGKKITLWKDLKEKAETAINAEVMSIHDWRATMMSLLTLYAAFVKAANHSIDVSVVRPSIGMVMDKGILPVKDKIAHAIAGDPDVALPALHHHVSLDDDGKLKCDLTRDDNVENLGGGFDADLGVVRQSLDQFFEKGVVTWLQEQGYTQNPDKTFADRDGVRLDKATFDRLKEDPDKGLEQFLNTESDLQFKPVAPRAGI